jgi:hypothetical protein
VYHTHHLPFFFSRIWLSLSVGCLLLAFLLTACGSGDTGIGISTGTTSTSRSASTPTQQGNQGAPTTMSSISCSRISEAAISRAIGLKVGSPQETKSVITGGNLTTCVYNDAATSQTQELIINYYNGPSASRVYDISTKNTPAADLQSISSLGDRAAFDTQNKALKVLKGDLFFGIVVQLGGQRGSTSTLLADSRQIATAILASS